MMLNISKKNQHVVPHQGGWAVKGAGNARASSVHGTQREAIAAAREAAIRQGSEMLTHGADWIDPMIEFRTVLEATGRDGRAIAFDNPLTDGSDAIRTATVDGVVHDVSSVEPTDYALVPKAEYR